MVFGPEVSLIDFLKPVEEEFADHLADTTTDTFGFIQFCNTYFSFELPPNLLENIT